MKEGRKVEHPEKTVDNMLQKIPHTKAWKFKPNWDLNLYSSIGGRRLLEKQKPVHPVLTWAPENGPQDILNISQSTTETVWFQY